MGGPVVTEHEVTFTVDDPQLRFARIVLDCDEAVTGHRRFRRTTSGWVLHLPRPPLSRLEYRLAPTEHDGTTSVVCDPENPETVRTAFGNRSVALMPDYSPPWWLQQEAPGGVVADLVHDDPVVGDLPIGLWSPPGLRADVGAPLLVVHDGPEYAELARLDVYAAVMVATGTLPPFRMALMHPISRDEWYAANSDYVAATGRALDTVAGRVGVTGSPVVMGASLGGLTALLVALAAQPRFGGVLAQSGSFFTPVLDAEESSYPHFARVCAAVEAVGASAFTDHPLAVALSCGTLEENAANNRAMARVLERQGHRVRLRELPDLHNYTAWRDGLDPSLTDLLRSVWGTQG